MTSLWNPGEGCDEGALARLAAAFPLPKQPMGEAWFIGGTRCLYTKLQGELAELSARDIEPALEAIASGTSSFGALEEWQVWFHYLLPRVLPRCHETFLSFGGSALLDALVTAFITQYPTGMLETPYPAFRADVLSTLGRAIMDKVCWPDGDIDVRRCLGQAVTAEFIPPRNRQLAIAAVADLVTGDTFADWLASLSTDPALEQEMADLPFEVHALYAGD